MSEFKFACPVCGQHITCDSGTSGTQMECPTCFRKLVVPQPPTAQSAGLVLTAAQVSNRPISQTVGDGSSSASAAKGFPFAAVAMAVIVCGAAVGAVVFRDKIFKPSPSSGTKSGKSAQSQAATKAPVVTRPADDTNWTFNLASAKIPATRATGWINGRNFTLQRATVQGGTLTLRQGTKGPADLGVTVYLFAKQGEDLAGRTVAIETNRDNAPRVTLRWKDDQQQAQTKNLREGYALRIEFGAVTGNRLPGRIYLCTPDAEKSWVAGTFDAEIRKPSPPKQPKAPKTAVTKQ